MFENIIIVIGIVLVLIVGFFIGSWYGIGNALDRIEIEDSPSERLHCFECEIDMPVSEKNGDYYCSNCGLYHGSKI